MLDDYKEKQPIVYNIMMNEIKSNYISHAYLIDENNNSDSFDIVMAFIKEVLCSTLDSDSRQVLCKRIDAGNYQEIKIIEPDGTLIKKQQILALQQAFSRSAIEGSKRVYIIRDADKMRSETANSMLKFLEEPDNNIMAILMTNNFNNLLSTIVSRCQVIRLNNDSNSSSNCEFDELVWNLIKSLEQNGIKTIIKEQDLIFNSTVQKERDKFVVIFDKMINMYYDILKISSGNRDVVCCNYLDEFTMIAKKNMQDKILNKINILIDMKDRIKNNVNINLLIDDLIVNIGGM